MATGHAQRVASIYTAEQLANAGAANQALINAGYDHATEDLNGRTYDGMVALDAGTAAAKDQYGNAIKLFDPYVQTGQKALSSWGDAIGLNGPTGNDNATAAFRASPGYQYATDQSSDQVARKNSALGILGSGNTMAEISDRAGHMADQEYGTYVDRLKSATDLGYSATGAQAGLTKGIGDLDMAAGTTKAGMYQNLGGALAGVDTGKAGALANNNMAVATGQSAAVTNAAQATDASKNANENLLLGIAGLGTNLLTGKGASQVGSAAKSAFSIFG